MRIFKYLVEKKAILLIFFRLFVELPAKDQPFWTTYETLAEIERVAKNVNSAWEMGYLSPISLSILIFIWEHFFSFGLLFRADVM